MAHESFPSHHFPQGTVIAKNHVPAGRTVMCILDPPLHAIGPAAYRKAQQNALAIYRSLQDKRGDLLPVALQEEFWMAYARDKAKILNERNLAQYLAGGGFGAVAGVLANPNRATVIRVETGDDHGEYEKLKNRIVDWVNRSAPALSRLEKLYETVIAATGLSKKLCDFLTLLDDHSREKTTWAQYLAKLIDTARSFEVEPPKDIILAQRTAELQGCMNADVVNWEMRRLLQELRARTEVSTLSPQIALELYAAEVVQRHGLDNAYDKVIELCDEWLARREYHNVDASMMRYAADSVRNHCMFAVPFAKASMGHGELASRLIELAAIVGIDAGKYPHLCDFAYQANLYFALSSVRDPFISTSLVAGVSQLEREIRECLADPLSTADAQACALAEMIPLIRELRALRIGFRQEDRQILQALPSKLTLLLSEVDSAMLEGDGSAFDNLQSFNEISEYVNKTIYRANKFATNLREKVTSYTCKSDQVIAVCDGYFHEQLTKHFRGALSSVFIVPHF